MTDVGRGKFVAYFALSFCVSDRQPCAINHFQLWLENYICVFALVAVVRLSRNDRSISCVVSVADL